MKIGAVAIPEVDVGEDDVDLSEVVIDERSSSSEAICLDNGVSESLKHPAQATAHGCIVFDEHDCFQAFPPEKNSEAGATSHQYGESRPSLSWCQRLLATGSGFAGAVGAVQPWWMLPGQHLAVTPSRPLTGW